MPETSKTLTHAYQLLINFPPLLSFDLMIVLPTQGDTKAVSSGWRDEVALGTNLPNYFTPRNLNLFIYLFLL